MKQLLFMLAATGLGTVGTVFVSAFYGVAVYYFYAVLRPQYMWQWSLPPDISWSLYVAVTTILVVLAQRLGIARPDPGPRGRPGFSAGHYWMLAFALWIGVSYIFARDIDYAWWVVNEYLKIFVMFFISALAIQSLRQLWILMVLAALALAYIAYEVNYLYVFSNYLGIYHNGYGGLDNNGAGLMLAMGAPLCYFVWEGERRWWRWAFLAFIPPIVHAVLMTYSRGAMVSLIAATPLIALRSRRKVLLLTLGTLFYFAVLPLLAGKEIQARFFTIQQHEIDASANSRRASWAAAWRIAQDYPVFGVGPRNSKLISHLYGADRENRAIHSQYLQIAADNGLVGVGLYVGALASVWWMLRRSRRACRGLSDDESHRESAVAAGVECSLAVFCTGALFLSLEIFELPFLLLLIGAQLPLVSRATKDAVGPSSAAVVRLARNEVHGISEVSRSSSAVDA